MQIPWEALVALAIYIIGSTVGFVWWMATQTITLQFVREELEKVAKELSKSEATYATKADVAKDFAFRDQRIDAAWRKLDVIAA